MVQKCKVKMDYYFNDITDPFSIHNPIVRHHVMRIQRERLLQKKSNKDNEKTLDVFISYARSDGAELASLIFINLNGKLEVFIDIKKLPAGKFDENLLENIRRARNFVLVLTPNALKKCKGDEQCNDWLHKEIVAALQFNCKIIPITHPKFKWPKPEDLPEDMRDICRFNGIKWIHEFQDAVIKKLEEFIREKPKKKKSQSSPLELPVPPPRNVPGVKTLEYIIVAEENEPKTMSC